MRYIALTIGPIYKTLQNAKNPKELFSASYLFSYIMREIVKKFKDREFITPYIKEESIFDKDSEVGLFHDRFIFASKDGDYKRLKDKVIPDVLKNLATSLDIEFEVLKDYLQISHIEKELKESANPILELNPYLDSLELFYQVPKSSEKIFKDKKNFLTNDKNIIDDLKKLTYNKYYTIVHVDADNMGKAIEDKNNISSISKALFDYAKEAHTFIKNYGGQTIYAGGDDLLFIAPPLSKDKTKTIFELCDEISQNFENKTNQKATLSFGVQISYVKYPLYEALESSREQLFDKAKTKHKNNIAFRVTKHSGQSFESIIHKGNKEVYKKFLSLTSSIKTKSDGMDNFLHSIHHKLDAHKKSISQISLDKKRLENFFDNYFNKDIHKYYREFFERLADYIHEVFKDKKITQEDKFNLVYASLRFVKFTIGDKK